MNKDMDNRYNLIHEKLNSYMPTDPINLTEDELECMAFAYYWLDCYANKEREDMPSISKLDVAGFYVRLLFNLQELETNDAQR
jgi:hypothetical protein